MKNLIKGTAILGAIALGAASTLVTAAADTTTPSTYTTYSSGVPAAASPAPYTTTSDATLTTTQTLSLEQTPTISFGTQQYSLSKQTYTPTSITPLQVANPGFSSGWTLTVAASPFTDATTKSTLSGSVFTIDPTTSELTADDSTDVSPMPTYITPVTLSTTASKIETAAAGAGVGGYTTAYKSADASLYVPAGNLPGAYTSTVTWTLADAPS